jgi:hypothetical protein
MYEWVEMCVKLSPSRSILFYIHVQLHCAEKYMYVCCPVRVCVYVWSGLELSKLGDL